MASNRGHVLSRRTVLAAAAVVGAAGAGAAVGALGTRPPRRRQVELAVAPSWLGPAIDREHALLAAADGLARAGGHTEAGAAINLRAVRADHQAHLDAFAVLLARHGAASTPVVPSRSSTAGTPAAPATVALLAALESTAAAAGAAASARLHGADAALLASISACESAHAELLSGT